MNVLLPTVGSSGDVHPFIGLGQCLRARGHRVVVMANPLHEETVLAAGLLFEPLGTREEAEALLVNPDLFHPRRGFATIARGAILPALRPVYEAILRYDPADTVVAAQTMGFGALLAQETHGYRVATIHLQPALLRSVYQMPINGVALPAWAPRPLKRAWWSFVDRTVIDPVLAPPLNETRAGLGLPPLRRVFHEWIHSPRRVIGLFPEWFAPPQPDWPPQTRLTGFMLYDAPHEGRLSPEARAFLEAGEPPLVVTFGSAMRKGRLYFEAAIEAARRLGRRALLLTREHAQLPPLPEGVFHAEYIPLSELLPHTAALIHHGGIGTLAHALAAGVPQLIMPLSHDQPDNAARLERLGVSGTVEPSRFNAPRVASILARLLEDPRVHAEAKRLAGLMDPARAREESALLIESIP